MLARLRLLQLLLLQWLWLSMRLQLLQRLVVGGLSCCCCC
jgi:hypothetical protein